MNTSILKLLKDNFVKTTSDNNRSLVELCITELSSGNFGKAIDLSEETIKTNFNDSAGWATKAISQAYLFDYNENLYLLKSALTSLETFKQKTTLTNDELLQVEAIFLTVFLSRTTDLIKERVDEVKQLRRQAAAAKAKATATALMTVMSAYAGSKSKSDVGKVLGYGGAVAGTIAVNQLHNESELLNTASKGVFGVAVANIAMTIGGAITLKQNVSSLHPNINQEANRILDEWTNTITYLYNEVIQNLLSYGENLKKGGIFKKEFQQAIINLSNGPEAKQFLYLSRVLGIEKTVPAFCEIESDLLKLNKLEAFDVWFSAGLMRVASIAPFGISLLINSFYDDFESMPESLKAISSLLFLTMIFLFFYFEIKPKGAAGQLKRTLKSFIKNIKDFKITCDKVVIGNMVSQDKYLN
jgi:hypothetical protein